MLQFIKMQGTGNDYIYLDCFHQQIPNDPSELAIRLSQRRHNIGSDGIVIILPSDKATCRMRMFNADGSEGLMCGNAVRCVGKYAYENGITDQTEISVETPSGIKYLTLYLENNEVTHVKVNMGKVDFNVASIPMDYTKDNTFIGQPITVNNTTYRSATAVSIGNPHLVIHHKDVDKIELNRLGPFFENHKFFPERINTEFAETIGDNTIRMRVWERGSGETMACGTGACAVVAAFTQLGLIERNKPITIVLKGGNLTITYLDDQSILMEGNAVEVFRGTVK